MKKYVLLTLAREFRKNPTRSEHLLWQQLRKRQQQNTKFRRQHILDEFIVDFYCPELNLAIEVDGPVHQINKVKDYQRQKHLENLGVIFLRVTSKQVEQNVDLVLLKINKTIKKIRRIRTLVTSPLAPLQ